MILTHLVLFSFLGGASVADAPAPVVAETFSGGWTRPLSRWPAEETDTEREARIHADRIRLRIIARPEENPAAVESQGQGLVRAPVEDWPGPKAAFSAPLWTQAAGGEIAGGAATLVAPDPGLAVDLAQLYTSAYLDAEIARHFWLQDEDDATVLLLAIAALH